MVDNEYFDSLPKLTKTFPCETMQISLNLNLIQPKASEIPLNPMKKQIN